MQNGTFPNKDYNAIKNEANYVYFNNGKHGAEHITNSSVSKRKIQDFLSEFQDIYTTNYDTILDDLLETQNRFPFHLHGGFSINHLNKNPDGRYSPSDAKLIWGINAESKFNELRVGLNFNDIDFNAFSFENSQISKYFDQLAEQKYDEIDILGYSGENDDHINSRIRLNSNIKNVVVYVAPSKINDTETQVRTRLLFGGGAKTINLISWDEFWKRINNG